MVTQRFSEPNNIPATPHRHHYGYVLATGALLLGMFSVASAGRVKVSAKAPDAVAAAQEQAAAASFGDDDLALSALQQLRSGNPENAVYSYMIAGHYARRHEWQPAIAALSRGNSAKNLMLAESVSGVGSYPALPVLRQLVARCSEEATRRSDETGESLLRESAVLAGRLARDATPCDLSVLQNAGLAWQVVERARMTVWEREERFGDADAARARLATRKAWWQKVNEQAARTGASDIATREKMAQALRRGLVRSEK